MSISQTILVSDPAGAVEYTWPTTITADHDISADTVQVSLGSYSEPASWVTPDVDDAQTDVNTRVVQKLVTSAVNPGTYYLWVRLTDNPEVVPRRGHKLVVV